MKITKVFNNNCVATVVDKNEVIVTGSGIGFQKKVGHHIDEALIEKTFQIMNEKMAEFEQLISKIPIEYFITTRRIVEYANQYLDDSLNDSITISLTDHISYAVLRAQEDIVLPGLFNDELKLFYPEEYEVGRWALSLINESYSVILPNDEIGYITIHIVNARQHNHSLQAQNTMFFLKEILNIIQNELDVEINKDSLAYSRLTTHLKYLSRRVFGNDENTKVETLDELTLLISSKLHHYNACVNKIASFVSKRFEYTLSLEERMYLSIHLYQIIQK
ncbi:PRD domain-containing protein [Erysipelothrix urinaevulpis]|uniref:PRD domain-containing protein n=1 Tax=Erysipelothrix urinaevulpis TaxID=2683717 RepID=UPI00135B3740|nr:PRD domain-containing protein [Erysipelothrix urinaevulpis]